MDVLSKAAVAEITKLVEDEAVVLRLEISRRDVEHDFNIPCGTGDQIHEQMDPKIAKVVEDGMVVLRMEICQRDNEILKLKDSIDILSNELKAVDGGQDRGSILLTDDDLQGSDDAHNASNGNMLEEEFPHTDQRKVSTPEVQIKSEPAEEEIGEARDALVQQGAEQTRFERESGTWQASSMYNAAGLGPPDYLGLAEGTQAGLVVPAGGGSASRGGPSAAVQQNPAAREPLGFSYYRNNYNPVRWRNIKSLMFKRGFACLYCGKNFTRRAHLERHKLIHTGEKPYGCEVCGRRFNQKSSVKEHMKIHQKGKPYKNPNLNATSLARYSSLGSFGEGSMSAGFNGMPWQSIDPHWARMNPSFEPMKPKKCFVCHFCCKVFERSGHLERHVRIHTGEKPYGCQICGRFFNQKGSLKLHLKTHRTEHISDPVYDVSHGEPAVTVKLEPETDDDPPPANAHEHIADDANFLWTSIIEESGRSLSPLASSYSAHAASAVSHMVKDWLGPGGGPATETGGGGGYGSPGKDVPLVKGKDDVEMMLQEQYAAMDTSQEGATTFEVPDLNDLEEGCSADVDKQNGFICLSCGTSYECWNNFESHQCKDPN
ncbi:hypothetical protein CRUP_007195 [Coryphaenoides rupestris]|nr:hypothetical protein CRUP_007195 [Coryphaenoides rupestris]